MAPVNTTTPNLSDTDGIIERLLSEIQQYRGGRGIYVAEMLKTARLLLDQSEPYPRQAEAAAYCIRQAVEEVFGDTNDYRSLRDVAQCVVVAKDGMQDSNTVNEKELLKLYSAVDDLKNLMCSQKPEARLKEIFKKSSGIDPEHGPHSLIEEYRRIKRKSNKLLHRVSEMRTDIQDVRDHYDDTVEVLTLIFLPSERLAQIERLAELPEPQKSNLDELRRIMKNAFGFDHFASRIVSPDWFEMMTPDMLKSPSGDPPWLLGSLAEHLKDEHVDAFVCMLKDNFAAWSSDDAGLAELGFVAYKLGDVGLPWMVRTLQESKKTRTKYDKMVDARLKVDQPDPKLIDEIERMGSLIRNLDYYAQRVFLNVKRPNRWFIKLAEHILGSDSTVDSYHKTDKIPAKLVECMDREFAIRIVEILVRELRAKPESSQRHWIPRLDMDSSDWPDYGLSFGINGQVASLRDALEKARDLGMSTSQLIETLDGLSDVARPKFEAWLYSRADDVAASEIVRYVVDACGSRPSKDEDGLLLDRLKRDGHIQDISEQIAGLLGKAPDTKKMIGRPSRWGISREECWHTLWARTMCPYVELPDEWKQCLNIVARFDEAERGSDGRQSKKASEMQDAATLLDRYGTDVPVVATKIAAEEPGPSGFAAPLSGHFHISDLEGLVRHNTSGWVEDPEAIIRTLRRPEYVAGYLRGLADAEKVLVSHADRIICAVKFARSFQYDGGASGSATFYHAGNPTSVDMVGLELLEKMVKSGVGLDKDSLEDVWTIVTDAVVCPDPETDEQPDFSTNFGTIPNKPHTTAVYTMLELMRHARQNNMNVPEMALVRLAKTMRLTGQHGVDYHLCIGSEASFMRQMVPEWFGQNEQYLFGSAASTELGRIALDAYLTWGQPDAVILEKYRDSVMDAVKRNVHNVLRHLLGCLLYGVRGYDPEYIAKSLMKIGPEYVSKTGWYMPKLLPEGVDADCIRRGIAFWDSVLKHAPKQRLEALAGFGWWADVPGIAQEQWEELMMRTCEMVEKLDWSQRVAERISTSQTITDAGWKILARLFSIDIGYDGEEVAKHAMGALSKTAGIADAPDSRSHLREVLLERNFRNAAQY